MGRGGPRPAGGQSPPAPPAGPGPAGLVRPGRLRQSGPGVRRLLRRSRLILPPPAAPPPDINQPPHGRRGRPKFGRAPPPPPLHARAHRRHPTPGGSGRRTPGTGAGAADRLVAAAEGGPAGEAALGDGEGRHGRHPQVHRQQRPRHLHRTPRAPPACTPPPASPHPTPPTGEWMGRRAVPEGRAGG
jgi:hypothetical protein